MKRTGAIFGVLLNSLAFNGHAATEPTDTDLRAFYCLPVVRFFDNEAKALLALQPPPALTANDAQLAASVAKNEQAATSIATDDRRLTSYILIRSSEVGSLGFAIATKQGEDDVKMLTDRAMEAYCSTGTRQEKQVCAEGVLARTGIAARISRCNDLSWLPF